MKLRKYLLIGALGSLVTFQSPAETKSTIKIGAIYPLTGSASFLGVPEKQALQLKIDEVNKAGGVNGHRLELIVRDTEGNGTKAAQQFRRLANSDKVDVIFGPSSSGESLETISLANELKIPQIAHGGTEQIIRPVTPYVFNSLATDRVAISFVLSYFKAHNIHTVALMSAADGYGQSGKRIINEIAPRYGVKVAVAEEFNRQDLDITAQVLRAKSSGADAMLIWSALPAPIIIARNAYAVGYKKPIFVGYGAASNDLASKAGPAGEGLYVSSFRLMAPQSLSKSDPVRPVVNELYQKFQERYHHAPANFAQHSYDAALILIEAIKHAKEPITRDSLRDAIEKVDVIGTNGHFRFSPQDHGGLGPNGDPLVMLQYSKGKWNIAD